MADDALDTWMGEYSPYRHPHHSLIVPRDDSQNIVCGAVANAGDGIHTTGTCRMGPSDDPRSVVDPDCKVVGLEGYVNVHRQFPPQLRLTS